MKVKLLAVLALLVLGGGAVFFALGGAPAGRAAAAEFLTTPVTRGTVTEDAAATGTIEPSVSYGLTFGSRPHVVSDDASDPATGRSWRVREVTVKAGDEVEVGQLLATAEDREIRAEIADAERSVEVSRAQVQIAEEAYQDAETTDGRRQTRMTLLGARSQLSQARRALRELRDELARATIRSPIAGTVTSVDITAGLDVPAGDAIVVQAADYVVQADVVESDLPSLSVGQTASVAVEAIDAQLEGVVAAIAPEASSADSGVVSYTVTVAITDPPDELRAGMTADVTITLAEATDVLTVPSAALLGTNGGYSVRVLGADGSPQLREVTIGLVTNATAEIRSGLSEGELVITGTAAERNGTQGFQGPGGGVVVPGAGPIIRGGPQTRIEGGEESRP